MNFFNAPALYHLSTYVTVGGSSSGIIQRPDQPNNGAGVVATRYSAPMWTGSAFKTLAYNNPVGTTALMLASSATGATWTYSAVPTATDKNMLIYGEDSAGTGVLLFTGSGAAVVSQLSYDEGDTWSAGPTGFAINTSASPSSVGFVAANNTWYAYSIAAPFNVSLSTDNLATFAITTTNRTLTAPPVFNSAGIGVTNPTATGLYERTTDFINWTSSTALNVLSTTTGRYVQAAGPLFFAANTLPTADGFAYTSTDGITWSITNLPARVVSGTNKYYYPAIFGYTNGAYVCVYNYYDYSIGSQLLSTKCYKSTDGVTWTLAANLSQGQYNWASKCDTPTRLFVGTSGQAYNVANYAIIT